MKIKAVKLFENGFMTEDFALGGNGDKSTLDPSKTYPSSLQNYVIDTGSEVILVDTGVPKETPDTPPKEGQKIYQGRLIEDYVSALKTLGYDESKVSKILLTHKHPDHSGELRSFKDAKIYLSETEADALSLKGDNIVKVDFEDGPYHNFEKSKKITDGIYLLPAPGHTLGNSIVVVEADNIFYMIHGDITYTDEALKRNNLSVVFEDKDKAADSLAKVRDFIKNNPTVYLSTHTPEALDHLAKKEIMKL